MKRGYPSWLLSILSGLLLSASWYWGMTILIFAALVPLLMVEDRLFTAGDRRSNLKLLGYSYISFVIWNVAVTWWVVFASTGGAIMAFTCNSLLMAFVFVIYSRIRKKLGKRRAVWMLIPIWLAWEHGHSLWDLSWTWLNLGNVFAFRHNWAQWYEFTGASGGSFWVLFSNIVIFLATKNFGRSRLHNVVKIAAVIIVPMFFSYLILLFRIVKPEKEELTAVPVVVVQPNADPYNVKFYLDFRNQFSQMLKLVEGHIDIKTEFLVLPETFITYDLDEEQLENDEVVQWFRDSLLSRFPRLKIVTGASTYKFYDSQDEITSTARYHRGNGLHYDSFNTGLYITRNTTAFYHKSRLVPGVERMPFPSLLKPLDKLAIDMGGTVGSLGLQSTRTVFTDNESQTGVAPVICYESVYADYLTEYIRNGADFIFIITNDGWWQDTPGYIQHLNYAKLRAIENRRQIARSANTGISCFIDEYGNISHATGWWEEAVISKTLYKSSRFTFFSRYGDLLSYASVLISALLIFWSLFPSVRERMLNKPWFGGQ